jgi:bla regulator protein blaR1
MIPTLSPPLHLLLTTSAYASLFAIIILSLQPVLRRYVSAHWRFILWIVVLVRFLPLPLPESRMSIFNWLPRTAQAAAPSTDPILASIPPPAIPAVPITQPHRASTSIVQRTVNAAPIPWPTLLYLVGATAVFLRLLLASLSLRHILRSATPIADPALLATLDSAQRSLGVRRPIPLLQTDTLTSPALVGLFRPRLLLPTHLLDTLTLDEFQLILLHEAAHLRRRDIALNYFFAFLTLVHWFNPLLWFLLPRIRADRELACDELVLRHTTDPATYGHTLLKIFQTASRPTPHFALGIVDTKIFFTRRIHMIAAFKKRPAWLAVPAVSILILICACTLTAAQTPSPSPDTRALAKNTMPVGGATGMDPMPRHIAQSDSESSPNDPLSTITLDQLSFDEVPLTDVITYLHDKTNINIVVNWKIIEGMGTDSKTPVTLKLSKVPFRKVLTTLLLQTNPNLTFSFEDNVLTISTEEDLASHATRRTEIYNVRDLLSKNDAQTAGAAATSNSPGVYNGQPVRPESDIGSLMQLIESSCSPKSWIENGGSIGSIVPYKGLLTITTTSEIHDKIHQVLETLRAADKETTK